jgi:hypothetical protein
VTPEAVNAFWTSRFPECPPVGYLFKHLYRARCARFRTSEDGSQSPQRPEDSLTTVERQNALLSHLFANDRRIILITTIPSELETPPRNAPAYLNFDPLGKFMQSLGMYEFELEFDTPSFWHLFVSAREHEPGEFDAVLRASSENPASSGVINTLLVGLESARLLYVYPGGADAVMEGTTERDELRKRFAAWSV